MTGDNQIISTDHPDSVTYRRAADAFRAGDLDALATTIHEDVIWHLPGTTWMARDFEGRGTLLAFPREVIQRTNGTFKLQDVSVQVLTTMCLPPSAWAQRQTARSGSQNHSSGPTCPSTRRTNVTRRTSLTGSAVHHEVVADSDRLNECLIHSDRRLGARGDRRSRAG